MRKISFSKRSADFLTDLPSKQFKQILVSILKLTHNPIGHDTKKMKGFDNLYRVDTGEYRVVYEFDNEVIYVDLVGKRNDGEVYNRLKRLF